LANKQSPKPPLVSPSNTDTPQRLPRRWHRRRLHRRARDQPQPAGGIPSTAAFECKFRAVCFRVHEVVDGLRLIMPAFITGEAEFLVDAMSGHHKAFGYELEWHGKTFEWPVFSFSFGLSRKTTGASASRSWARSSHGLRSSWWLARLSVEDRELLLSVAVSTNGFRLRSKKCQTAIIRTVPRRQRRRSISACAAKTDASAMTFGRVWAGGRCATSPCHAVGSV